MPLEKLHGHFFVDLGVGMQVVQETSATNVSPKCHQPSALQCQFHPHSCCISFLFECHVSNYTLVAPAMNHLSSSNVVVLIDYCVVQVGDRTRHHVYVWDLDETLILFNSMLDPVRYQDRFKWVRTNNSFIAIISHKYSVSFYCLIFDNPFNQLCFLNLFIRIGIWR